jgi:hypothetical protein
MPRPERWDDRVAIRELMSRYCRAVDRLDPAALREVFHPDATIDRGSSTVPREPYIADILERHAAVPVASHQITNVLVDFLGEDDAFVQSWGVALERRPDDGGWTDWVFRVRYGDRCRRREGTWSIFDRLLIVDAVTPTAVPAEALAMTSGRFRALRSTDDPIERKRAEALDSGAML